MRAVAVCLLVTSALAWPALGEMYKCQGSDGRTLYTTDASQCPGAAAHDLKGQVQSVENKPRPSARPTARRNSPAAMQRDLEATNRAQWQHKKREAQNALAELEHRLRYLDQMVTACNRGAELWTEDPDTGIRSGYSCNDVKSEHAEVTGLLAQTRLYLEEGLEDECRRAGCLPGWLR